MFGKQLVNLGASAAGVSFLLVVAAASAQSIPVANPSFEDLFLANVYGFQYTAPGWTASGDAGTFRPGPLDYGMNAPPQGLNVGFVSCCSNGLAPGVLSQTTSMALAPNTAYRLSYWIGHRLEQPGTLEYLVELTAGPSVLIGQGPQSAVPGGAYGAEHLDFFCPPGHPAIGLLLGVRFSNSSHVGRQTNIDDVHLEAACLLLSAGPSGSLTCPAGSQQMAVVALGGGPLEFNWQVQLSPGTWTNLGNDPAPLPCGGGASAYATPINSPNVTIGIRPCPGNPTQAQHFQIRCIVTNACGSVTSNEATYTICPADFNCSGSLTVNDIFDFLAAWFAGTPTADFNQSGAINVQDIFDFLAAWFAGC